MFDGTTDFHPSQMEIRNKIIDAVTKTCRNRGFVTIETPIIVPLENLRGKYGENEKLIFEIKSNDGQNLALRYDNTVPLARYVVANKIDHLKRYSIAKSFRNDKPKTESGRFREFIQMDIDMIGVDGPMSDAELISTICDALTATGVGKFKIKLNHKKLLFMFLENCGIPADMFDSVCMAIDDSDKNGWEKIRGDLARRGLNDEMISKMDCIEGIPESVEGALRKFDGVLGGFPEYGLVRKEILDIVRYLEIYGVSDLIVFDFHLARGVKYYDGIIFEGFLVDNTSKIGAICGGGRCNMLTAEFGDTKPRKGNVGGAIGMERIFAKLGGDTPISFRRDVPLAIATNDEELREVIRRRKSGEAVELMFQ